MDYLYEYLIFLAQAITVVIAIVAVLAAVTSMGIRRSGSDSGHLEVRKLNDSLSELRNSVRQALLDPGVLKKQQRKEAKAEKQARKAAAKAASEKTAAPGDEAAQSEQAPATRRVFVLDFKGDLQANAVKHLRTEITAVLTMASASDEVLLRLESPGGAVHGYGLAASQLDRLRQHDVRLVAAVDKVAASGGYMMAVVADHILAAPFALIGSIGVVAQVPNVHRLLKKHDVDVEVLTAGKYKRTLTVLGENTEEGRQKFIEELEDVHALFQEYVGQRRPLLELDQVATGEAWYGQRALEKKLVDELSTSDEYLTRACEQGEVFHVQWVEHKRPIERLLGQVEGAITRTIERITGY
jgi:serine protease SohB